jgi:hypothetical protein
MLHSKASGRRLWPPRMVLRTPIPARHEGFSRDTIVRRHDKFSKHASISLISRLLRSSSKTKCGPHGQDIAERVECILSLNERSARRVLSSERGNSLRAHHCGNSPRMFERPHTSIFWNASPHRNGTWT